MFSAIDVTITYFKKMVDQGPMDLGGALHGYPCFGFRCFKARVALVCTLSCLRVIDPGVTPGTTPAFFTQWRHVLNICFVLF